MRKEKPEQRVSAFTLVEIMIVVAIIAILATIAVPSWLRSRMRTQNVKFINDLRVYSQALDTYAVENKTYPPNSAPGTLSTEFAPYIKTQTEWVYDTPIGGTWDIETYSSGVNAAVGSYGYGIDTVQMGLLEELGDNGDSGSGVMRILGGGYYMVVEEVP